MKRVVVAILLAGLPWILSEAGAAGRQCGERKVTAGDAKEEDYFSRFVAIHDGYALIGAYQGKVGGVEAGAAYVYYRDGQTWVEQARLTAADPASGAHFGYAVSVWENYALVGASLARVEGVTAGAAYIFRRDDHGTPLNHADDTWSQQAKLLAADQPEPGQVDLFGVYVAIEGDYAVVGADTNTTTVDRAGAVYVFVRDDNGTPLDYEDDTWIERDRLTASDAAPSDMFGRSVGISGDWIISGAYADDDAGSTSGSAYIFRRDDGGTPLAPGDDTWIEHAKVLGGDTWAVDQFGVSTWLSGECAVVGALNHDTPHVNGGAAYVFCRDDGGTPLDLTDDLWTERAKLSPSDGAPGDLFGRFVSIGGDDIVVGAYRDDDAGDSSGSAYYFRRDDQGTPGDPNDDTWPEVLKLTAHDAAPDDWFGYSVAVHGDQVVIGARNQDTAALDAGAAYLYELRGGIDCNSNGLNDACEQDCNTNGVLDSCDLAGGTSGDCNSNSAPDECDVTGGTSGDCNSNGAPDECDTAWATSPDCNTNSVPDECETLDRGLDLDGDLDLADFARLQACFTGPGPASLPAACCIYDFEPDGDVDLDDYTAVYLGYTGPSP
ncbi:MAG: hypothetical protein GY842_17670 [bacterium]|nr:hypothetical protein [bacterium]